MESKKQLESFTAYCKENPSQRFWQALRNWAQHNVNAKIQFVLTAERDINSIVGYTNLRDTFYDA